MKGYMLATLLLLVGCNGLDRLIQGKDRSRNNDYDANSPIAPVVRQEPYAVFAGYAPDGEFIYLVHWTGNALDKQGMLENAVDAMNIPKYID